MNKLPAIDRYIARLIFFPMLGTLVLSAMLLVLEKMLRLFDFVATEGGVLLAVGGIKAADWAANTHILYLSAVVAERRGEGIGRQLLQARLDWITDNFKHGRILVSTGKTRRFVEAGFKEVRHSLVDGRRLMIKRF